MRSHGQCTRPLTDLSAPPTLAWGNEIGMEVAAASANQPPECQEPPVEPIIKQAPPVEENLEQSLNRLTQLVTRLVQNQAQEDHLVYNTTECVRSQGAKNFDGSRDSSDGESCMRPLTDLSAPPTLAGENEIGTEVAAGSASQPPECQEPPVEPIIKQAPSVEENLEQSLNRLTQLITRLVQNPAQEDHLVYNAIEHVRSLGAKNFDGSRDSLDGESCTRPLIDLSAPATLAGENEIGTEVAAASTNQPPECQEPFVEPIIKQATSVEKNLEQSLHRLTQLVTRLVQNQAQEDHLVYNTIERVRSLGAKNFDGSRDSSDGDSWLTHIERIFDVMRCDDNQRLLCATFLLEGRASYWWTLLQRRYRDAAEMTWSRFRQEFSDFFSLTVHQDAKSSIIETEKKESLGQKRSSQNWSICGPSSRMPRRESSYAGQSSSLQQIQGIDIQRVQEQILRGQSVGIIFGGQRLHNSQGSRQQGRSTVRGRRVACRICGRFHGGQCQLGRSGCYRCGQIGHLKRDCPMLSQSIDSMRINSSQLFPGGSGQYQEQGQQRSKITGGTSSGSRTQSGAVDGGNSRQEAS